MPPGLSAERAYGHFSHPSPPWESGSPGPPSAPSPFLYRHSDVRVSAWGEIPHDLRAPSSHVTYDSRLRNTSTSNPPLDFRAVVPSGRGRTKSIPLLDTVAGRGRSIRNMLVTISSSPGAPTFLPWRLGGRSASSPATEGRAGRLVSLFSVVIHASNCSVVILLCGGFVKGTVIASNTPSRPSPASLLHFPIRAARA